MHVRGTRVHKIPILVRAFVHLMYMYFYVCVYIDSMYCIGASIGLSPEKVEVEKCEGGCANRETTYGRVRP